MGFRNAADCFWVYNYKDSKHFIFADVDSDISMLFSSGEGITHSYSFNTILFYW